MAGRDRERRKKTEKTSAYKDKTRRITHKKDDCKPQL
jgi:hypothetical protein